MGPLEGGLAAFLTHIPDSRPKHLAAACDIAGRSCLLFMLSHVCLYHTRSHPSSVHSPNLCIEHLQYVRRCCKG